MNIVGSLQAILCSAMPKCMHITIPKQTLLLCYHAARILFKRRELRSSSRACT